MNDSRNNPKSFPPPDDFSATTPNIKIPKQDLPDYSGAPANDWEKTNYNYSPKDLGRDEWSQPPQNQPPVPPAPPADYNRGFSNQPPAGNQPKEVDWGMTQANIKLPSSQPYEHQPPRHENHINQRPPEYHATTPMIQLPENIRQQYQNLPPAAQTAAKDDEKKGGVPPWLWAAGGLLAMFFFAVIVLGGVYILFFNKTGFDVIVKGAPAGSDIRVNGSSWNVSTADGSYKLMGLKAGETKKIEVVANGWDCGAGIDVVGADGEQIEKIIPCKEKPKVAQTLPKAGCDPSTFTKGDIPKSHACANEKLASLTENFTVQELLDAMNLYIIQFASGKYNINPEDTGFLEKAAGYMKKLPPNVKVEVGGHTDNTGKNNQLLSENRANAVREVLIRAGVKPEILLTRGYAETQPKDTNATEDGKFRNRRIEYSAIIR